MATDGPNVGVREGKDGEEVAIPEGDIESSSGPDVLAGDVKAGGIELARAFWMGEVY
jgi:hypothetical protein